MAKVFDDDTIACAASLVLDPGADIQSLAVGDERRQTWGKVATIANTPNLQWIRHEDHNLIDVEHLTCPMIMRTDRLREIGGFDTHLFDHFREESFHSWRFHVEGHRVVIVPTAEVWHLRAPSGGVRGQGNALDDARKFNLVRKDMQPGIHVNLTHAMGDLIASTPMFAELRKKNPGRNISVWHPLAKDVFEGNPNIDVICKSALSDQRTHRIETSIYGWMGKNDWRGSLANAYCKALDLPELDNPSPALYNVEPMGEIENYVVITPQSNAKIYDFSDFSRTKHWPQDRWAELIQWMKEKYQVEVIHLSGPELIEVVPNTRLINDVSYRDAFRWIKGARCVVSIDTMAAHAAAALNVPAVVLFGRSDASMYGYDKGNIVNLQGMCGKNKPCNGGVQFQQDKRTCPLVVNGCNPCMNHDLFSVKDAVDSVILK
jgi:ADP-heptose:LPS heptosyltransferase